MFDTIIGYAKKTAKAIGAGIGAGATYLLGVWSEDAGFLEAFETMTGVQWLGLTLSILGVYGITYRLTNRTS